MNILQTFKKQRGFTALLSILIILSVGLIIALSINTSGMNEMQNTLSQNFSSEAFAFADSCTEEAIIQLKRDEGYSGGILNIKSITCNIQITDNGSNNYTITALASSESKYYRTIETNITVLINGQARNIIINSWEESS